MTELNDIFKITLKHKIYELCINTFFDKMNTNFGKTNTKPVIGARYSKIVDHGNGETFYNCTIIPLSKLSYYNDLLSDIADDDDDLDDYAFGITFQTYVDNDSNETEEFDTDDLGETHFTYDDVDDSTFVD